MAAGRITNIKPLIVQGGADNEFQVDVEVNAAATRGRFTLQFIVQADSLSEAPEAARKVLFELGSELGHSFDRVGSLP